MPKLRWWVDGQLRAVDPAALAAFTPPSPDTSSYTTALVRAGRARWHERHAARLERDARMLGLDAPGRDELARIFDETGRANFGDGEGIVRVEMQPRATGRTVVIGIPRPVGQSPPVWCAISVPFPHDGPTSARGAKLANRTVLAKAGEATRSADADEVLLFDEAGVLIEGARSNLFVVTAEGELCVPDLEDGGVAGIARSILVERAQPSVRRVAASEIENARELVATNAVRGAVPVVALDGRPVGSGEPGPVAARLQRDLEEEEGT